MSILKNFGCNIPEPTTDRLVENDIDVNQLTEIERRVQRLGQLLTATSTGTTNPSRAANSAAAQAVLLDNMAKAGEIARAARLDPYQGRNFSHRLARDLAVSRQALGLGDNFTRSGWVRNSLNKAQRYWRGGLNRSIRELGVAEKVAEAQASLTQTLRPFRIPQADLDYIAVNAQELGWVPYILQNSNVNAVGRQVMLGKVENFVTELRDKFNLPDEVIDQIMETGRIPARLYSDVADLTFNAGLNMSEVDLLGYFSRQLSDEANLHFNWKWEDDHLGTFTLNDGTGGDIHQSIVKSRSTFEFVVEDEIVLDYVLRNISRQDYGDPNELYRRATGVDGAGIGDVLDDHRALRHSLFDVLKTHPEAIDNMVDSGLLSKIPLTSAEIFNMMSKVYEFPFTNLRQVFQVDWNKGWAQYQRQLEHLAQTSGIVHYTLNAAINENWAVPLARVNADPQTYRDFVPLSDVIPQSLLPKGTDALMLSQMHVHPVAADLVSASLEMQMSPVAMGAFGRVMTDINQRFRQLALATIEYIPRQIWNSMVSLVGGGGNLLRYGQYFTARVMSVATGRNVTDFLDNSRRIFRTASGNMLTEKELWEHLEDIGYINRWEPMTGDPTAAGRHFSPWNPRTVIQSLQDQGIRRTLQAAGVQMGAALDNLTYPIRFGNQMADDAGRFAGVVSTLKRDTMGYYSDRVLRGGSGREFNSVEAAVDHWSNYFFYYDDTTRIDRRLSSFVVPFWGFHSKNLPASVRHAIRRPSRYVAFQRLYALANSPLASDDRLNESTIPAWQMEANPIYFKLPNGQYFAIPTTSLDPFSSAYSTIEGVGDAALNALGIWTNNVRPRATGDRLDDLPWNESQTNRALDAAIEQTYPFWQSVANSIQNRDDYDRPLSGSGTTDTFLGYQMPRMTRMWLETMVPILATINRYNPWGVFGEAKSRDPFTGVTTIGQGSQMPLSGGVPRSDADNWSRNNPYATMPMQLSGVKIYPVDWALNAGYTYDDLRRNVGAGERFIQQMETDLLRFEPNAPGRREREARINQMRYLVEQTRADMNKLEDWARQHGLNVLDAAGRLREDNIRIGDLPNNGSQHNQQR